MKKIFCSFVLLLFILISSCLAATSINSDQVGVVKMCGVSYITNGEDAAKNKALEDAKRKAVGKAASRFISSKEVRFQSIISNYKKYVGGNVKVLKKQKVNGKYLMFCDVPVNFAMIDKDIKSVGENEQNKEQNELDEAVFLVRVVGLDNAELVNTIPMRVLVDFQHAFKEFGFSTKGGDLSEEALRSMLDSVGKIDQNTTNYSSYRSTMLKDLQTNVEVTLAVLGEIRVTKVSDLGNQVYVEVDSIVESIGLSDKGITVIGSHREQFNGTRSDKKTAMAYAIQKAAVNTSKHLASMTLNYWKTSKR